MRVLFISTSIPPCTDMQTTRNMYIIKSLIENENSVDILTCGEYQRGQSSFDNILNKTSVYRTPFPKLYRWHFFAQKLYGHTPFLKVHNILINYYAQPDLYAHWENLALKKVENDKINDYDVIITSSGSYTAHYIGYILKKEYELKWVADYGDPWGLNEYGQINKKYYKKEQKILKYCDGLVFTTQATIEAYRKNYDNHVPYCLVQCGYENIIEDNNMDTKKISFVYTGIAYNKSRNLSVLFEVVRLNPSIRFSIVGTYSQVFKDKMQNCSNITFEGRVSYAKSLDILSSADVLVHIGNFGTMQIPGKTYIYLSSKKPILYIQQQDKDDPTLNVLSEFGGVVSCLNTMESIENSINYIIKNYKDLKRRSEVRAESVELQKYRWDNLGSKFCKFVNQCTHRE